MRIWKLTFIGNDVDWFQAKQGNAMCQYGSCVIPDKSLLPHYCLFTGNIAYLCTHINTGLLWIEHFISVPLGGMSEY